MRLALIAGFPAMFWCAVLAFAGGTPRADADKDRKLLEGKWEVVTLTVEGLEIGLQDQKMIFTVSADKISVKRGNDLIGDATFKFDPTKSPRTIDFQRKEPLVGIYEVSEKELKLCVVSEGKDRPGQFESKANDGRAFVVLKRAKE